MSESTTPQAVYSAVRLGTANTGPNAMRALLVVAITSAMSVIIGLASLQSQVDLIGINTTWIPILEGLPNEVQRSLRLTLSLCVVGGGIAASLSLAYLSLRMRAEVLRPTAEGLWWRRAGHMHAQIIDWAQVSQIHLDSLHIRLGPHEQDPVAVVKLSRPMTPTQLQALDQGMQHHAPDVSTAAPWIASGPTTTPEPRTVNLSAHPRGFGLRTGATLLAAALFTPMGSTLGMLPALASASVLGLDPAWAATAGSALYPVSLLVLALVLTVRAGRPLPTRLILGPAELTVQCPSLSPTQQVPWIEVLQIEQLDDRLRIFVAPEVGLAHTDNLGRGIIELGAGTSQAELTDLVTQLRERTSWRRDASYVPEPPAQRRQTNRAISLYDTKSSPSPLHVVPSIGTPTPAPPRRTQAPDQLEK